MKLGFSFPVLLSSLAVLGAVYASAADQTDPLYRVTVRVTGDREETRVPAIPEAFELAAAKITGNPDIAQDPHFQEFAAKSRGMVWSYTYHDRMFGRPIHDEQGTRDRPFDLSLQFDHGMMDGALAAMGERSWPEPRPKLALLIAVKDMARSYLLTQDGEHGGDQRDSFADASARFAIPIAFPESRAIADDKLAPQDIDALTPKAAVQIKASLKADAVLVGHLEWNAAELGWTGTWHLADRPGAEPWSIHGVNFDAAFRNAVGGAAKRLRPQ